MEIFKKFLNYLLFKKTSNNNNNLSMKLMNRSNTISIIMFVLCMIILIYKCVK